MLPRWENSQLVLHAAHGTGNWIGAASALIHDDYIYLAYRDRHPVEQGRGNRVYVARSPIDDGVHFDMLCAIDKEEMDAESLERPALDVTPDGDWDLYLEGYAKLSLKKKIPIAARKDDLKVLSGRR